MTKRWSSTHSLDGQTKRQASKAERRSAYAFLNLDSGNIEPEPPYPAKLGDNWRNPVTGTLWGFREHDGDNVWIRIAEDDKS